MERQTDNVNYFLIRKVGNQTKEDKLENIIMPLYKCIMHGNLNYCVHTSGHLSQTRGCDTTHSTRKVASMAGSMEELSISQEISTTVSHRGTKRYWENNILL